MSDYIEISLPTPEEPQQKNSPGKPNRLKFLLVFIPLLLVGGGYGYTRYEKSIPSEPPSVVVPSVTVMKPKRMSIQDSVVFTGYLQANSQIYVIPRVGGTLNDLLVKTGDYVSQGDVVATIDSEHLDLTLRQAEAAYFSAKSQYDRVKALYDSGAATPQNYEQVKGQYDAYESQYELAKLQLEYATIRAPIDGKILVTMADPGSMVSSSSPLMMIGDIEVLKVNVQIPDRYYSLFINNPDAIQVNLWRPEMPGDVIAGRIESVSPFVSPESKTFEVIATSLDSTKALIPGMFMEIEFVLETYDSVLTVPGSAVQDDSLWVLEGDTAVLKSLESFGAAVVSDEYVILPEEYKDTSFITKGFYFLESGDTVNALGESSGS